MSDSRLPIPHSTALLIFSIPGDGLLQTFGQSDQWSVADQLPGACDVGKGMANITGSRLLIHGRELRVDDLLQFGEQLIECDSLAYSQVHDLSNRISGFSREQIRVNHVGDVCEISGLLAVAVNHRCLAIQ